jgi:hypothetical protein
MRRAALLLAAAWACKSSSGSNVEEPPPAQPTPTVPTPLPPPAASAADPVESPGMRLVDDGRVAFRSDTLGSETWFGEKLADRTTVASAISSRSSATTSACSA